MEWISKDVNNLEKIEEKMISNLENII